MSQKAKCLDCARPLTAFFRKLRLDQVEASCEISYPTVKNPSAGSSITLMLPNLARLAVTVDGDMGAQIRIHCE